MDVDKLKTLYTKAVKSNKTSLGRNPEITKRDFDFKNPEDVEELHMLSKRYDAAQRKLVTNGAFTVPNRGEGEDRLTNITFDITGKNPDETLDICRVVKELGYKICYVWVITNRQEAMIRNVSRSRVVGDDIFHAIHNAVNEAVPKFLQSREATIIDDAWLVFSSTEHAGASSEEMDALVKKRAIELDKTPNGFNISTKLMHRILATVGNPEIMTQGGVDKERRRYLSQDDVIRSLKDQGYDPSKSGSYSPTRQYDGDFLV